MSTVLIVAPLDLTVSGNSTTANRLARLLSDFFDVTVQNFSSSSCCCSSSSNYAAASPTQLPPTFNYDITIGLHALRTARWLLAHEAKFLVETLASDLPRVPHDIDFSKSDIIPPAAPLGLHSRSHSGAAAPSSSQTSPSPSPSPPRLHCATSSLPLEPPASFYLSRMGLLKDEYAAANETRRSKVPPLRPLVLIFGGTDVNENSKNEKDVALMRVAVDRAVKCVCFSDAVLAAARRTFPHVPEQKFVVIPQTVDERIWSRSYNLLRQSVFNNGNLTKPCDPESDRALIHGDAPTRPVIPGALLSATSAWTEAEDGTRFYWGPESETEMDRVLREAQNELQDWRLAKRQQRVERQSSLTPEFQRVFDDMQQQRRSSSVCSLATVCDEGNAAADAAVPTTTISLFPRWEPEQPFTVNSARRWIVMPAGVRRVKNQVPVLDMLVELNKLAMQDQIEAMERAIREAHEREAEQERQRQQRREQRKMKRRFERQQVKQQEQLEELRKMRQNPHRQPTEQELEGFRSFMAEIAGLAPVVVKAAAVNAEASSDDDCDGDDNDNVENNNNVSTAPDSAEANWLDSNQLEQQLQQQRDEQRIPEWGLLLLGPPIEEDYATFLEAALAWYQDYHRENAVIVWHPRGISSQRLTTLLYDKRSNVSVVVNSSLSEGQPQAIMEAMAVTAVQRQEEEQQWMFFLHRNSDDEDNDPVADVVANDLFRGFVCAVTDCPGNLAVVDDSCGVVLEFGSSNSTTTIETGDWKDIPVRWAKKIHDLTRRESAAAAQSFQKRRDNARRRAMERMQPLTEMNSWVALLEDLI